MRILFHFIHTLSFRYAGDFSDHFTNIFVLTVYRNLRIFLIKRRTLFIQIKKSLSIFQDNPALCQISQAVTDALIGKLQIGRASCRERV